MPQVQHLCVVTTDDMEEPLTLIRDALQHYLYDDGRWRLVEIELINTDEGH